MFTRIVTGLTEDQALPALPQALNTDLMLPLIAQACGLHPDAAKDLNCSAEVLKHKLGRRCTIRYTLAHTSDPRGTVRPVLVIGKLYREKQKAARTYCWTRALRSGLSNSPGQVCIPAPLMLVPDLGLVLQEYVEGTDLRHTISGGNDDVPLSLAAQWLARLHTAPPLAGLKVASLQDELWQVDRLCKEIASDLPVAERRRLRRARDTLYRLAGEIPTYAPVMIHRDFSYQNVLWDGQRVWVLDFDQLSMGDPALDVGHFVTHLENLAYRTTDQWQSIAEGAGFFVKSYVKRNFVNLDLKLPFYRAYTFLRIAASKVRGQRRKSKQAARVLTSLACQEIDCRDQK